MLIKKMKFLPLMLIPVFVFSQQTEYEYREGIYFEIKSDTNDLTRYTTDNQLYKAGNTYYFSYEYTSSENTPCYYERTENGWQFVSKDHRTDKTITTVKMSVKPDLGKWSEIPDYDQTIIRYNYLTLDGSTSNVLSETGLVENEKNIWLHPPRVDLFEILELNPFPFIQMPIQEDKKWEWKLEIGPIWGDSRWKTWEGLITNHYQYEMAGDTIINSFAGELSCHVVKSSAVSELGETFLTAYFNEKYGFVKLEYINIDQSLIILTLKEYTQ